MENDNAVVLIKTYFCMYALNIDFNDGERTKKYLDMLNIYLGTYKDMPFAKSVTDLIKVSH